ncbi:ice-binding family protein [Streptomyces sp. NBC_00258]|uniref:ice-binding family protein n=1 Tax=Streptomyces sp. NBC_00258 TaxID=2903642 RepID=UPI002E285B32|nr:ice-binding family protein [Streptomyces sp. NBC_00258]
MPLGTAASYGVLGGATVTNTGPTIVNGLNVGVSPGPAITGFFASDGGPGIVTPPGALHTTDAHAAQAKEDTIAAYNQAAGQTQTDAVYNAPHEYGGQTLTKGLYRAASSAAITGTLTLDAEGDPNAVWVFQIGSTLTTAADNSTVSLVNGASPCNVYWQVGSSATLGTDTSFVGTILADTSISATTGATINGRLLADAGGRGDGAVTLDSNRIFQGSCGTGGTTGGLITGGVIAGATSAGTSGSTTVGVIGGVPTGGGTGGTPGGLLGGVLTSGGTSGGALGGLVAGATSGGAPGGATGGAPGGATGGGNGGNGGHGGATGGNGHDHHGEKPGKPGHHDHGGKPDDHGRPDDHVDHGRPDDHGDHGKPDDHGDHGGKPDDHGKPDKHDGHGGDHGDHDQKSA